jgi:hypothetical protein
MISQVDASARVARGAALLDVVRPGWFNRIDVGTLTLHDPCGCIVGQLAGHRGSCDNYTDEWIDLFGANGGDQHGVFVMYDGVGSVRAAYQTLQDAWIEAIADRRFSTTPNGTPARSSRDRSPGPTARRRATRA